MVAEHHQERHRRRLPHPPRARRHVAREPNALGARLLLSQPPGPRTQEPEIIDSRDVPGACLSRMPGKRARPVLRGPRRSNAPGLPDRPRADRLVIRPFWWARPVPATAADRSTTRHAEAARSRPESRRARRHQPGGPPPGSTATTLTDQATADRTTPNVAVDTLANRRFRTRRTQLQRARWSPCVVVRGIHGKRPAEMPLAED